MAIDDQRRSDPMTPRVRRTFRFDGDGSAITRLETSAVRP